MANCSITPTLVTTSSIVSDTPTHLLIPLETTRPNTRSHPSCDVVEVSALVAYTILIREAPVCVPRQQTTVVLAERLSSGVPERFALLIAPRLAEGVVGVPNAVGRLIQPRGWC